MVDRDPTFLHEYFDVMRAQEIGHIPPDARENDLLGAMGSLEAHNALAPSFLVLGYQRGGLYPKRLTNKNPRQNSHVPVGHHEV